jgi:uncharacterized protein YkwD
MAARLIVASVVTVLLVPSGALAGSGARSAERAMLEAVNDVRHAHQLRPLRPSRRLERSAGGYAARLMKLDLFGHASRIAGGGSRATQGEALAIRRGWRPHTGRTVRLWMRSPPHAAVLLDRRFRRAGAGMSRGLFGGRLATVWVLRATS